MRRVLVVGVLAAVAASGCGGTTGQGTGSTGAGTGTAPRTSKHNAPDPDARIRRELRRYMRENFGPPIGPTTWYGNIKGYEVNGGDVTVKTDVYPDTDAPPVAQSICAAIIGASVPDDSPTVKGLTGARVLGSDGGVIKRCERAGSTVWPGG
jgi:hypothetical protein